MSISQMSRQKITYLRTSQLINLNMTLILILVQEEVIMAKISDMINQLKT